MVPAPRKSCVPVGELTASQPAAQVPILDRGIRAHSERQAMDWALVLASQGIEAAIMREPDGRGWNLQVGSNDLERAQLSIRQFRIESRRFGWRQPLPGSHWTFHWGVIVWMMACAFVFQIQEHLERGLFLSSAVHRGEWWRAFTSVWLHQDPGHLSLNLVFGGILLGLAMGRYGAGLALLTGLLSGALGNALSLLWHARDYVGLGASGLVMGALGMLAAQAVPFWRAGRWGARLAFTTFSAGAALFILLGTDPTADVAAHTGGFIGGLIGGAGAAWIPDGQRQIVSRCSSVVAMVLVAATWWLALQWG